MKSDERVILFSTHHMDEVETLCDRILVLHQGNLVAEGMIPAVLESLECSSLQEVFAKYAEQIGRPA